jgi:ribonuclease HII
MARRGAGPTHRQAALLAIEQLDAENAALDEGYRYIAGIDEVGRGSWAGPVVAAAVVLPDACYRDRSLLAEVTDSKLLTPAKRERLAEDVKRLALAVGLAWVEAPAIDQLNILGATCAAMCLALESLSGPPELSRWPGAARRVAGSCVDADFVLVDAVHLSGVRARQRALVRADRSCLSVAAASIVAKVARDEEMRRRATKYPSFDFAANKGYGTRRHVGALRASGVTPLHRRSFAPVKYFLTLRDHIAGALPAPAR